MRRSFYFLFFLLSWSVQAQNRRTFFPLLDRTEKISYDERLAEETEMNILGFDDQKYNEIIFGELNKERKRRHMLPFIQDSVFNQVCNTTVKHISRRKLSHDGLRSGFFQHQMDQSVRYLDGENRMFTTYTFYTNLTNLNRFSTFYYDRKEGEGTLNLYRGNRKIKYKDGIPQPIEKVPVRPISEKEWAKMIFRYLLKRTRQLGIKSKLYSHVGIAVRLNEYTVRRQSIPHAFVMIIVGGKQTQEIKPRRERVYRTIADSAVYEILK